MTPRKVTLIPGDLIGRDLAGPVTELLATAGAKIDWEWIDVPADAVKSGDSPITEDMVASIRRNGVALKGPIEAPVAAGYESPSVTLRKQLDLYAGVRRVMNLPGLPSRYSGLDLVVIRENTEDVYAGLEHVVHPGVVQSMKVVTRRASERIFRFAFRYARSTGRRRVAIIHKANIMKMSDGLFLRVGKEIGADYPDIETRGLIVDNTCMQLVQNPHQFDVLVCGNLYGDIISDLAAGLVGGISAVWGVDQGDDCQVFECIHGRVPELLGKDLANPAPFLLPAVSLLHHVGQHEPADRVSAALGKVLSAGKHLTRDLGGKSRTSTMIKAINDAL
jgi:isocitrate dehydrogenase (NAD+)